MLPRFFLALVLPLTASAVRAQTAALAATASFASGVWCGNVTPTSASVVVRLTASGQKVRLQVGANTALTPPIFSGAANTAAIAGNTVTLTVQGLQPDTEYYYGVEVAGVLRGEHNSRGRFRTFPAGRGSFRIAFASCSDYRAADQRVFDAILAERPLLFIHTGDLHYNDTNTTNPDDYRANYDSVLNQPNESALYRNVPVAYVWDDHDSMGNDSNGTFVGVATARAVYGERVPHYPIAAAAGGAIAQSFTIGRVRVLMTDTRSAADPPGKIDDASKSMLGAAQKTWFKQELVNARDAGCPLVLWISTNPWIGQITPGEDNDSWRSYQTERTELANFIRDNRITNLVMLSGDMHALAYDDGTHSDYATGGGAPLTVLHAAALTQGGSIKGGPYTGAPLPGDQHYGILEVYDVGGPSVACRFLGMRAGEGTKLSYIFSSCNTGALSGQALVNISTLAHVNADNNTAVSGFVISGDTPRTVLVRAVGPTLAQFGLTDALAQPQLVVYQGGKIIASNDAWAPGDQAATSLNAAFDRVGAFRLTDRASRDAAILLTLAPGSYTLSVKSANGASGSALVEIYNVL